MKYKRQTSKRELVVESQQLAKENFHMFSYLDKADVEFSKIENNKENQLYF